MSDQYNSTNKFKISISIRVRMPNRRKDSVTCLQATIIICNYFDVYTYSIQFIYMYIYIHMYIDI